MTGYQVLLFFHIASVVVWLGAGTTLGLLGVFGGPASVTDLGRWLGPRVIGPASLGALAFGLALVGDGHWTFHPLWIKLGLAAFAASFALTAGVRVPAIRRMERGEDVGRLLRPLAVLELLVLYAAVLDMVAKPA